MRRIILFVIAVLFFLTSIASVGAVYLAMREQDRQDAAIKQATDQATNGQTGCGSTPITTSVGARPLPAAFIPPADVTVLEKVDVKPGTGPEAKAGDCIQVLYHGTLATNGQNFDGNYETGVPIEFSLAEVVKGWQDGIPGMKVGGVRRLVIPSDQAYGEDGSCKVPDEADQTKCKEYGIPPNTDIVFEVELIAVK